MTFSLRSGFDLGDRRALMIHADRATVYLWRGGEITSGFVFSADESGLEQFGRYLAQTTNTPLYALVDVVEEEYRQDTIPHVFGSDRRAVLQRKQARLFRGTSYCHAIVQGREKDGRRDDRVLLTALVKPDLVTPWLEQIAAHRIALAGIYSLPILSGRLLPVIGATGTNVLLVTLHGAGGLRQTFFRDRQFKLSRLAPMPRLGTVPLGAYLMGELDKLRRYLSSLGLLAVTAPLEIFILGHGDYLDELEARCRDSEDEHYFLVDVAEAGRKLAIGGVLTTPYSDLLFVQALLAQPPRNHYAQRGETRYFTMYRARLGMLAASVALLLGGIGWSGLGFIEGLSYQSQAAAARQQANFYQARNEVARRGLPPTPVEPRDISNAVELIAELRHYKAMPLTMLRALGAALDDSAAVDIDHIDWSANVDPNRTSRRDEVVPTAAACTSRAERTEAGVATLFQIAEVEGRIDGFNGDFRAATEQVEQFAARLRAAGQVCDVTVMRWPVDTRPSANLSGNAVATDAVAAEFALRIVIESGDGAG